MYTDTTPEEIPVHAAFSSLSRDIEDDIENFAIERMLGGIDGYTDKENVRWEPRECLLVASGWWKQRKSDFPPSQNIALAYVGFHWDWTDVLSYEQLLHFRSWQPIGCRDPETARRFSEMGVECHFSGSMTLGLDRWIEARRDKLILSVDVPETFTLPDGTVELSLECRRNNHPQFVRSKTKELLEYFQKASMPCSSRRYQIQLSKHLCFL